MDNVPQGLHGRQGLCQRRLGRQLRQRRRRRPSHGQGARRQGRGRHRLPRGRLLRHHASATTPSRRRSPRTIPTSRSSPSRASAVPTSRATPRRRPRRMLVSNRGMKGIWAVWDVPAEGVISAARTAGRDDLVITTVRSWRERRHRHGAGRLRQGAGRPAALRPGRDGGDARGLRPARQGRPRPMWRCLRCRSPRTTSRTLGSRSTTRRSPTRSSRACSEPPGQRRRGRSAGVTSPEAGGP